jgi:hypothetical protein
MRLMLRGGSRHARDRQSGSWHEIRQTVVLPSLSDPCFNVKYQPFLSRHNVLGDVDHPWLVNGSLTQGPDGNGIMPKE